jgi:hypothetical protein
MMSRKRSSARTRPAKQLQQFQLSEASAARPMRVVRHRIDHALPILCPVGAAIEQRIQLASYKGARGEQCA